MRFGMKTWYTYHYAAIQLANTFDGFYISNVSLLKNTKADTLVALTATLALPTNIRYRLIVATRHLFYPKFGLEVSEVHTTSTHFESRDLWFPIIDYALHNILLDDPRRQLPFNEGLLIFIMTQRWRHFSAVNTMAYSFAAYPIQNHKFSKMLMVAYAGAHQPDSKLKTDCIDLAIIGQWWSLMQCNMQNCVKHVKLTQISYTNPRSCSIQQSLYGLLKPRESMW